MGTFLRLKAVVGLLFVAILLVTAQVPAGYYYKAQNKKKDALKTALSELAQPLKVLKYGGGEGYTWQGFYQTDRREDGSVIDMYSSKTRYFNGFRSVSDMHIEHSLPKSWWGGHEWNVYKDLFHLYPADGSVNMSKSNNPLGIVTGTPTTDNGVSKIGPATYPGYTGNVFEPSDEFKGDFARSYFYVSTVYQSLASYWNSPMMQKNTYPVWNKWSLDLLMQWHRQDPVSIKERVRNQAVYSIQGNRNPFIDYPELVDYIWGADTLSAYPFPVETDPFLLSPVAGVAMDFGVILQGDSAPQKLNLQGVNLNASIQLSLKNNQSVFRLNKPVFTVTEALQGVEAKLTFVPNTSGFYTDTLIIQGGGLSQTLKIALSGIASAQFMTLEPTALTPVGARLNWITAPDAASYQVEVFQGTVVTGDLLISSYVEGSGNNKAIELYNGTGKTVDLSLYTLQKQSNGTGGFNAKMKPEGLLPSGSTCLIAYNIVSNVLKPRAQLLNDSVMSFNGNDAVALFHNGILTDIVGYPNAGSVLLWGENKTLKRKAAVTHPSSVYDESEWEVYPIDFFDKLGSHAVNLQAIETPVMSFSQPATTSFADISGLQPATSYNYRVRAITDSNPDVSVNDIRFTTNPLQAPEINLSTKITANSFTANWEPDLYSNQYQLNLFRLVGSADTTEQEGFDKVVKETGKPLPEGWSGNPGGSYISEASSGNAIPSIKLQNTGEWIQTKTYPHPVSAFSFMYRFPSSGTGSYFFVESLSGGTWNRLDSIRYVNTSKYFRTYTFSPSDAVTAFRVSYALKVNGNIALDDFSATYGNQDTLFIRKNYPVTGNSLVIDSLSSGESYYHQVCAVLGEHRSAFSEVMKTITQINSGTNVVLHDFRLQNTENGIRLTGLSAGSIVAVFNINGTQISKQCAKGTELSFMVPQKGLYILSVTDAGKVFRTKFIHY